MNLSGTPIDIINTLTTEHREIPAALKRARGIVEPSTRAIAEYQAAALYALAKPYNRPGARVLEIGTAQGYSAAILALALPDADIVTLNPHHEEAAGARRALSEFGERIRVLEQKSWDFLSSYDGEPFDFIFVDGDHKNVRLDLPWFKHLRVGGCMVFHDFSPNGTYRACPPVYRALLEVKAELGREFDVLVVDDGGVGMAGFVKQPEDDLSDEVKDALAVAHAHSSASYSYLTALYGLAANVKVDGCLVECGTTNGGSAAALALGLKAAHGSDPRIFLFDNFTGVPKPAPEDGDKALQRWTQNQPGGWAKGDKATAREAFKQIGIKGARIIEGDFAETFANDAYKTGEIAVLHIDATTYASTLAALERFHQWVATGGLIIISAYHHWEGIRRAVSDFYDGKTPQFHTLEKGIWWLK